jgi:hypothetical protein
MFFKGIKKGVTGRLLSVAKSNQNFPGADQVVLVIPLQEHAGKKNSN